MTEHARNRLLWILTAVTVLAILAGLVADAHAGTTAPPVPSGHTAPPALVDNALRVACPAGVCDDARRAEVAELTRRWHWVGLWYVENTPRMPAYMAWWLPAQAFRESSSGKALVGDNGRAVGHFHLWPWSERYWARVTGRKLDRMDPDESARVLMHAVAASFVMTTPRACGRMSVHRRARLAAARVGRGPRKSTGEPRCDFRFWSHGRGDWVDLAGVTVRWARNWWHEAQGDRRD
jgi:hypothetical protein